MNNVNYSHIIWDWNGTLFNDLSVCIEVENSILREYGLKEISGIEEYHRVFCFPVIEYYKKLGFDFTRVSYEEVANEYVRRYDAACKSCGLQEDAILVLEELKGLRINQYILSASSKESLANQMEKFDIHRYFVAIMGIDDNLAGSKVEIAEKFIHSHKLNPEDILMVGDTVHDYEVSKALACDCVLIPNGHHSRFALEKTEAVVLRDITEIPSFIK